MVSIAIPASCVGKQTCASLQQATFTLYQISRACVLLGVDEIIIFDNPEPIPEGDTTKVVEAPKKIKLDEEPVKESAKKPYDRNPDLVFCANMLQYLITPPYLRKILFKRIGNPAQFKYAQKFGKIPGLADFKTIAQGIAVPKERKRRLPGQKKLSKRDRKESGQTPYINLGFDKLFKLRDGALVPVNSRVFVDFSAGKVLDNNAEELKASGLKGYSVRAVTHFSHIFTQSPLKDGYSQTIYIPSQQFKSSQPTHPLMQQVELCHLKNKENVLLVFGKWIEIQNAVAYDEDMELDDASALFDGVSLGTERARLEDSVMVTLARKD